MRIKLLDLIKESVKVKLQEGQLTTRTKDYISDVIYNILNQNDEDLDDTEIDNLIEYYQDQYSKLPSEHTIHDYEEMLVSMDFKDFLNMNFSSVDEDGTSEDFIEEDEIDEELNRLESEMEEDM
jgi:hypothetical protein